MSARRKRSSPAPTLTGRIDRHTFPTPATIGIISDTHIFDDGKWRDVPPEVLDLFRRFGVTLIVHAGDIVVRSVLDRLESVAPVLAVYGNNESIDLWHALPERIVLEIGTHRLGVVHGHGGSTARATARIAFQEPLDLVIYGHSHIPMIEEVDGVIYFNPGSATDRRWARHFGIGIIEIDDERVRPELILFEKPAHLATIDPTAAPGAPA